MKTDKLVLDSMTFRWVFYFWWILGGKTGFNVNIFVHIKIWKLWRQKVPGNHKNLYLAMKTTKSSWGSKWAPDPITIPKLYATKYWIVWCTRHFLLSSNDLYGVQLFFYELQLNFVWFWNENDLVQQFITGIKFKIIHTYWTSV